MPKIKLDVERDLRWTMRTDFRLGGLDKPPSLSDLGSKNGRRAFHTLCVFLWACLDDSPFESPEDLAEYLSTPESQIAALEAMRAVLVEAGYLQKKSGE